jgi:SpoVK/Ycf46/Vps4 family AAA+-type ATPase
MGEIEYTVQLDAFKIKSLSHYTTFLANSNEDTKLTKYNIISNRDRKERVWGPANYKTFTLIPYGVTPVNYKESVVEVELGIMKCGVNSELICEEPTRPTIPYQIIIRGESKEILDDYINDAQEYYNKLVLDVLPENKKIRCFVWDENYWDDLYKRTKRPLSTVHLHGKETMIYEDIKKFMSDETRDKYLKLGVPYKRNYLFEGYPGTGKTSLIYSLASELNMDIAIINFDPDLNDVKFLRAIQRIPKNALLVLEDIDGLFEDRTKNNRSKNMISFSVLLNILDGLGYQEQLIIIMTTNFKCTLDNALKRPGRIDYTLHFDFSTKEQIQAMFTKFLPEQTDKFEQFYKKIKSKNITTAILQQFLFTYMDDEDILDHVQELIKECDSHEYDKKLNLYM